MDSHLSTDGQHTAQHDLRLKGLHLAAKRALHAYSSLWLIQEPHLIILWRQEPLVRHLVHPLVHVVPLRDMPVAAARHRLRVGHVLLALQVMPMLMVPVHVMLVVHHHGPRTVGALTTRELSAQ